MRALGSHCYIRARVCMDEVLRQHEAQALRAREARARTLVCCYVPECMPFRVVHAVVQCGVFVWRVYTVAKSACARVQVCACVSIRRCVCARALARSGSAHDCVACINAHYCMSTLHEELRAGQQHTHLGAHCWPPASASGPCREPCHSPLYPGHCQGGQV